MSRNILEISDVNLHYGSFHALKNMSLDIPENEITAFIGPSGCGKSTLLKALTRVISDYKGAIILDNIEILKEKTKDLAKKISFLPQSPDSNLGLTVSELMAYGRFPYQKGFGVLNESDFKIIDWALDVTGTKEFKHKRIDNLSGGQKQRICIARALLKNPKILILDDSTSAVDTKTDALIRQAFLEKIPHTTRIIISQRVSSIQDADQILVIDDGKISGLGTHEELLKSNVMYKETFEAQNNGGDFDEQ